jgi:hypothetical protein
MSVKVLLVRCRPEQLHDLAEPSYYCLRIPSIKASVVLEPLQIRVVEIHQHE